MSVKKCFENDSLIGIEAISIYKKSRGLAGYYIVLFVLASCLAPQSRNAVAYIRSRCATAMVGEEHSKLFTCYWDH